MAQREARRGRGVLGVLGALGRLAAFLGVAVVVGVLLAGLALPASAGAGALVSLPGRYLETSPPELADTPLPQTSVMLAADGSPIAYFYEENRTQVPLASIAPVMREAVVAIEDARFYEHGALDPKGVARALLNNVTGGSREGASTLTQQYVKNVALEQATMAGDAQAAQDAVAPTLARKVRELREALAVEQKLSKDQILEGYLNTVYFGRQSYGIQAAAQRYFGTTPAKLTLPQAATLAGMVQDASLYDPIAHPKAAVQRRDTVLTDLRDQGRISPAEYAKAVATPLRTSEHVVPNGCTSAAGSAFFCDYVVNTLLTDPAYASLGGSAAQRLRALQTGGLVVRTTLDRHTQDAAVNAVNDHVPPSDRSGLAAAAVTVEPGTGKVLALAQDRTYSVQQGRGRTSVDYAVDGNLGGGSGFQTGSSFKPFTLARWLQDGHSLDDTVNATQRDFSFGEFTSCGRPLRGTQPYRPGNSEGSESGDMSVLQATANSVNVAYVEMESQLDLCDVAKTAESLGVHTAQPATVCSAKAKPSTDLPTCLPSLTLGVENVAPLTMAAAYAGFASGGTFCPPRPVLSLTRAGAAIGEQQTLPVASPACTQALSPDVASGVNEALRHVLTDGTAAGTGGVDGHDSAGKTGTTDGPYDSWFVGYTAQRSTAVWVADPGGSGGARKQLTDISVAGQYYPIVYGASIAAPLWKDLMTGAMKGLPSKDLP